MKMPSYLRIQTSCGYNDHILTTRWQFLSTFHGRTEISSRHVQAMLCYQISLLKVKPGVLYEEKHLPTQTQCEAVGNFAILSIHHFLSVVNPLKNKDFAACPCHPKRAQARCRAINLLPSGRFVITAVEFIRWLFHAALSAARKLPARTRSRPLWVNHRAW